MKRRLIALLLIVFAFPMSVMATADNSEWTVKVGPFLSWIPKYSGANEYKLFALPYVDMNWNDQVTFNTIDGLGYDFYNNGKGTKAGVGVGYSLGRRHNETALIKPLKTIGYYGTVKAFATYMKGPLQWHAAIDRAFTHGYRYVTANAGVYFYYPWSKNLIFKAGPTLYWGDAEFMRGYYGVTDAQAADHAGLKPYRPSAGFEKVNLDLEAIIPFGDKWTFNPFINYIMLFNKAADSSIVKTRNQYAIGAAVVYQFV